MSKWGMVGRRALIVAASLTSTGIVAPPFVAAYAASDVVEFNIPRGDLGSVITQINAAGGTQIIIPADLAAGRVAGPIIGRKSVRAALEQAVAGTGLVVGAGPRGGYTIISRRPIAAAQGGGDLDIPDIDVVQNLNGDNGFQAGDTGAIVRVNAPIKEIPLSVNVVTNDAIKAENLTSVGQAIQNVSGVQVQESANGVPVFFIRGFQETSSPQVNGVLQPPNTSIPITDIDRVEVLKGPTSILTGSTDSGGGAVNVTTKAPTDKTIRDVTAYIGSYGYKTLAFDLGGIIPQTEGLTYRLNASGNIADTNYAGYLHPHEHLISPSLRWQDDKTSILIGARYIDQKFVPGAFTLVNTRVPIQYYYTAPIQVIGGNGASQANKSATFYSEFSRKLWSFDGYDFAVHSNNSYSVAQINALGYYLGAARANVINIDPQYQEYRYNTIDSKNDLSIKKDYGFAKEFLRFGLDFESNYNNYKNGYNQIPIAVNILTGTPSVPIIFNPPAGLNFISTSSTSTQVGYSFLTKTDSFDNRLHLLGTVRSDYFDTKANAVNAVSAGFYHTSYTVGLAFDLLPWATIYGSRADGAFAQPGVVDYKGSAAPPQLRVQDEVGVKYFFFDRRLSVTTSVYELAAQNVPAAFSGLALGGNNILIISGQKSKGAELDFQGEIFRGLNVIGSYSYTNGLQTDTHFATPIIAGVPNNSGSIFATYKFQEGPLSGLTVGGGALGQGKSPVVFGGFILNNYATSYKLPAYAIGNAVVAYSYRNLDFNLRVSNVTNRYYLQSSTTAGHVPIGQPRTFLLTATAHL